jgi:hypothetical protein
LRVQNVITLLLDKGHKNPIKDQWPEPSPGRQKGKAKERSKDAQLAGTKKKKGQLVPLVAGSYLTAL